MKILILSGTPWDDNNSFGNTFSNLFGDLPNIEIANIYCSYGVPNNSIVSQCFQISLRNLVMNLLNSDVPTGQIIVDPNQGIDMQGKEKKAIDFAKKKRLQIFFWARDFIWKIGRWDSPELRKFIDDFAPDLLYIPVYYSNYLLDIGLFLKSYTGTRMIAHISDDCYSLRQFSLSPLYWIDRFVKRKKIRALVRQADFLHVISDIQKSEYEQQLGVECRLFRKGLVFDDQLRYRHWLHNPIRFVYTGNIGNGRWRSLAQIGRALEECNKQRITAELYIYTFTPLNNRMKKALDIKNTVHYMGGVSSDEVLNIQKEADVLIHVESLNLKERLKVHQSFSTKLVDYMHTGNCIFAVGTKDIASIDYLLKYDAAIVATTQAEISDKLRHMLEKPDVILEYGNNAWNAGKKNHQKEIVSKIFEHDIKGSVYESFAN